MIPVLLLVVGATAAPFAPANAARFQASEAVAEAHPQRDCRPDDLDGKSRRGVTLRAEGPSRAAPLAELEQVRSTALEQVNELRRHAGRAALTASTALDTVAQRHAEDMLHKGFYDHRGPDGRNSFQRVADTRYRPALVAENIARGIFTPEEAIARWMASSGHRRNVLDREAREIGLGVAAGDGPRGFNVLWVMVLARPQLPSP